MHFCLKDSEAILPTMLQCIYRYGNIKTFHFSETKLSLSELQQDASWEKDNLGWNFQDFCVEFGKRRRGHETRFLSDNVLSNFSLTCGVGLDFRVFRHLKKKN